MAERGLKGRSLEVRSRVRKLIRVARSLVYRQKFVINQFKSTGGLYNAGFQVSYSIDWSEIVSKHLTMPAPYTGQCLCGAVRLSIAAEPAAVLSCFCQHCSKGAGGPNQVIAKFATRDMEVSADDGSITEYTFSDTSSGLPKEKAFCKACGTPLWTVPAPARGTHRLVRTALLDGGLQMRPRDELFVKNRPAWMAAAEGVTRWEEGRK